MRKTILTENDYNNFYKTVLYKNLDDPIDTAIHAAYRDLCRTIHGFSRHEGHDRIFGNCITVIKEDINHLFFHLTPSKDRFDSWHQSVCDRLICYSEGVLTYGQAQKWINMTLKYISMFNHSITESTYEYYHVPVDNYILQTTNYKLSKPWSRLNSYEEYLNFQKWFKNNYDGIPLDVEFNMWIETAKENKSKED